MASSSQGVVVRAQWNIAGRNGLVDKYFFFAMSLLVAVIVVVGFSQSVNANLFHAAIPRPLLLWIHGAAFSSWVAFYILQSALVRTHNVKVHRFIGWFGAALGACMVPLGCAIAVIMGRFDIHRLHESGIDSFLVIPLYDMVAFGMCLGLAIAWRKKPNLHRRLLFIATCCLLDAPFGRFDVIFNNNLFFVCLDLVMLLGVERDLLVDRRIHKVYRVAMPLLIAAQAFAVCIYRFAPAWWLKIADGVLG